MGILCLSYGLCAQFLLEKYCLDIGINSAKLVHLGELFSLNKSEFELFELLFDGRWHKNELIC